MADPVALLLEDEAIIALDVEQALRAEGFDVISVNSRRAARDWLTENPPPTVAIVDIELADGRALDVAIDLSERGVPFVVHTGDPLLTPADEPFQRGVIVSKPCSDDQLSQAVRSAVLRRSISPHPPAR